MKAFTIATAILASTAAALPTPAGILSSMGSSAGTVHSAGNMIASEGFGQVHSVVSVAQGQKTMLVQLEKSFASRLTGFDLGTVTSPIGQVVQVAPKIGALNLKGLSSGYLTLLTSEGQIALVELSSEVQTVLSTLALPQIGTLVGGFVGTLQVPASGNVNANANVVGNSMHITGLNGNDLLVKVEPTVTSLLSQLSLGSLGSLGSLSSLGPLGALGSLGSLTSIASLFEGSVGSVVGQVPIASNLAAEATALGSDPTKLIGVVTQNGASVLLVEVESVFSNVLSSFGLGALQSTIGSVVPVGSLPL